MRPNDAQIAEVKAEIARQNRLRWRVAVEANVHPVRFSAMLNGRMPMPPEVYASTCSALRMLPGEPA